MRSVTFRNSRPGKFLGRLIWGSEQDSANPETQPVSHQEVLEGEVRLAMLSLGIPDPSYELKVHTMAKRAAYVDECVLFVNLRRWDEKLVSALLHLKSRLNKRLRSYHINVAAVYWQVSVAAPDEKPHEVSQCTRG